MTIQYTHDEQNEGNVNVAEQPYASNVLNSAADSTSVEVAAPSDAPTPAVAQEADMQTAVSASASEEVAAPEAIQQDQTAATHAQEPQKAPGSSETPPVQTGAQEPEAALQETQAPADAAAAGETVPVEAPTTFDETAGQEEQSSIVDLRPILEAIQEEESHAFDIIAAYQQAASREIAPPLSQLEMESLTTSAATFEEQLFAFIEQAASASEHVASTPHDAAEQTSTSVHKEPEASETPVTPLPADGTPETQEVPTPPPFERPVSPLLRPATRLRVPRHGNLRQYEQAQARGATPAPQSQTQTQGQPAESAPLEVSPASGQEQSEHAEPQRPARRYRFDRPANNGRIAPPRVDIGSAGSEQQSQNQGTTSVQPAPVPAPLVPETESSEDTAATLPLPTLPPPGEHGRRRPMQERGRDKEQPTPAAALPPSTSTPTPAQPTQELPTSALEQIQPMIEEIAPEDLPPLEYAELQKATGRRRRRHRATPTPITGTVSAANTPPGATERELPKAEAAAAQNTPVPMPPVVAPAVPPKTNGQSPYTIVSGYTVNQMNQGNDTQGPFMGPEPSPARGSVFSRDGRTVRAESQRTPVYPARTADGTLSPSSIQQLASVLSQSIQTQTDRMVAELRRSNQAPTNVSVSLPPFPSTERVGVFVDVANLLYSARTMRIAIDFGKLLDFLRGNRRLIRAQAYCPTSPQAGDEQMFLHAVKGLGYRITTKNYKTFASGAKKADLDLDLCMDVVRLVEGRAVDCIVLVSGDSDFMPMLDFCSDHGVRVEVAAFDEAMSATLRQSCDLFINLSMLEEIRS